MSLIKNKAIDIMKKATGANIIDQSVFAVPHGFIGMLENKEEIICTTDGICAFADRLDCLKDEYKFGVRIRTAKTNNKNSQVLRMFIKWTAASACKNQTSSIGLEDEFGIILPTLANSLRGKDIKPVITSNPNSVQNLAQALGETAWQALATGLVDGYGAEFSYAQNENEIMNALISGYTGIVMDCADKVNIKALELSDDEIDKEFAKLPDEFREALITSYVDKEIILEDGKTLLFTKNELSKLALCYGATIAHLQYMYNAYFKSAPWPVDYIIYLGNDKLSDKAHYLIANELLRAEVKLTAIEIKNPEPNNMAIAKKLEHKLRIILCKGQEEHLNSLPASKCLLDIRPVIGHGLVDALVVLAKQNAPIIDELFAEDKESLLDIASLKRKQYQTISPKAVEQREKIKVAIEQYQVEYAQLMQEKIAMQQALIAKFA